MIPNKNIFRYLLILLFLNSTYGFSQKTYYQNIYRGGVTAYGTSSGNWHGSFSSYFNIHLKPNSTIQKAFLIYYNVNNDTALFKFLIDGNDYNSFFSDSILGYSISHAPIINSTIYITDVTNSITPNQNYYTLTIPQQTSSNSTSSFCSYYLIVFYSYPTGNTINASLILNNQDLILQTNTYHIQDLNPIDYSKPVGFAIDSDILWDTVVDGSNVYINGNNIGLIGGSDENDSIYIGAGVKGCFYYEDSLMGLSDDTPDSLMNGSDGLADIRSYISGNSFSFKLKTQSNMNVFNNYIAFPLVYTTPCDTFSVTTTQDTTLCSGETLQLHASGGTQYEWSATNDSPVAMNALSCTNCPNPIFSGDSSQVYTVKIWNNDSCSVVRPVRITVSPKVEKSNFDTSPALCGVNNDGTIAINGNKPTNWNTLWAVSSEGDTLQTNNTSFSNLSKGEYTVFYTNSYGCKSEDTSVIINSYTNTALAFTAEPLSGKAPLQVNITNNSHYTDTLIWLLNGEEQLQPFTGFSATTAGEYEVQLIGWQNAKTCADTLGRTIWVYDNTIITVSGAISPNGDGKNDVFYIKNLEKFPGTNVWIYNRWGNLVYHSDNYQNDWSGTSQSQTTIGKGNKLPEGTYYYVIQLGGDIITKNEDRVKEGFFYLKR